MGCEPIASRWMTLAPTTAAHPDSILSDSASVLTAITRMAQRNSFRSVRPDSIGKRKSWNACFTKEFTELCGRYHKDGFDLYLGENEIKSNLSPAGKALLREFLDTLSVEFHLVPMSGCTDNVFLKVIASKKSCKKTDSNRRPQS